MADPNESTKSGARPPVGSECWKVSADESRTADWQVRISDTSEKTLGAEEPQGVSPLQAEACPSQIGRYAVETLLGSGAFGKVYRCYDDVLKRRVAVKVPHRRHLSTPELYLKEARVLASLEHPAIVPVYDLGRTEDGMCYVVSQFIEGSNLKTRIEQSPLSYREAVGLVATIAEALHYAHLHGVVHRDVKPANILIDLRLRPYLADFGLALREEEFGRGGEVAGTPIYMSPEQARHEGHLVDGRSDIFSLGVVFYELLTTVRPFRGSSIAEILERIRMLEPRPPRQIKDSIPKELERICLKALSKRGSDRYTTALDMSEDLLAFLAEFHESTGEPVSQPRGAVASHSSRSAERPAIAAVGGDSEKPLKIVPKGLRSFDQADADFFLKLLPGPHDRHGLPESIHFWKTRIEQADPERTFRVGIVYGPSGCGKSSLVKAGLLPRLAPSVVTVYVEASGEETEDRLLRNLRRQLPEWDESHGLVELLTALRRGQCLAPGEKVLLVIDQFEQWLHAHGGENDAELIRAVRQCDGIHVQCLVMVRDDFWLAVSRFMQALEIRLFEGENSRLVDLFDQRHARKVLAAMGEAFGTVPESEAQRSKEQNAFLDQAVAGLSEDGKVVSVRLSLFAEMFKSKPWTPSALREMGGAEGVGVAFLEETFSSLTAPPHHRLHQITAQAILADLLPEGGTDIKGHMHSREELLDSSGCRNEPHRFDEVMALLDNELRLVTPADSESLQASDSGASPSIARAKKYQLTHDYLVPSLRSWLTRKQRETRKGRAELCLAERSALWNVKPENRFLPSLWEFLGIRWLTERKNWTAPQRKMMLQAGRVNGIRSAAAAVMLLLAIAAGMSVRQVVVEKQDRARAEGLVDALVNADIIKVPSIVIDLEQYRTWADQLLKDRFDRAEEGSSQRLNMALALLPVDESKAAYLRDQLLVVNPTQFPVVRDALVSQQDAITGLLWNVALDSKRETQQRFQAACALATYSPDDKRWSRMNSFVAGHLVTLQASDLVVWRKALRPAKHELVEPLVAIYRNQSQDQQQRSFATETLADYAADQPQILSELLMDADERQFAVVFPRFKERGEEGLQLFHKELNKRPSPDAAAGANEVLARRQANAAVALLKIGHAAKVWPLLKHTPDPTARSYLIHRLVPLGADVAVLLRRLDEETDVSSRRALILCLGEFDTVQLPVAQRQATIAKLLDLYRNDPDPGLHGAVTWLLRKKGWEQGNQLAGIDALLQADYPQRQARKTTDSRQWFVNRQGQTFVIIDAQQPFAMGSPSSEPEREEIETQHRRRIRRRYAMAASAVTKSQFERFRVDRPHIARMPVEKVVRTDDSPQTGMTWYEAAEYCNWLSKKEGIPPGQWCYDPNKDGSYAVGMRLKNESPALTGYRLPTEAEWECACRAGATTRFYFGEDDALLANYAWYKVNSGDHTWPAASLKPNDLGLFDMHGNAWAWCGTPNEKYPEPGAAVVDDAGVAAELGNHQRWAQRGGAFDNTPRHVRAAYRMFQSPDSRQRDFGFRPVQTIEDRSTTKHAKED
jgi:serine/threonine protein kinase/formylglycine-generating enzyme required for sulfatase activity